MQLKRSFLPRRARVAAAVTVAALGFGTLAAGVDPAGADPKQFSALVGVGSDTTQDVLNGLAGEANGQTYTPARSSQASGRQQLVSWDAIGTTCITPKAPGATFFRPNGSTNGVRALSRAVDGTNWLDGTCGAKPLSGLVNFARSSAGPASAGTALTYIPFARDALTFAYYANGVTPVTTLTSAQLTTLFTTGPQTIGGVEIVPCSIQTGSGTFQSWNTAVGASATQMDAATAVCRNAGTAAGQPALIQENDAAGLAARGALPAFAGKQVVIGFSASNFISQNNGAAASQLAPGVDLGAIDALGKPYTGTIGSPLSPSSTFYANTTYGRTVYNVVSTAVLTNPGNNGLKTMFVGATSGVCTSTSTITTFGFLVAPDCGDTTLQGPLRANS